MNTATAERQKEEVHAESSAEVSPWETWHAVEELANSLTWDHLQRRYLELVATGNDGQSRLLKAAIGIKREYEENPTAASDRKSLFISATESLAHQIEIKKLIGKYIERGQTGQLFGPTGDGKSFVALDMLLAVGTGGTFNGIQCEKGLVFYAAGEGHSGVRRRIKACHIHKGYPDLSNVYISRSVISFDAVGIRSVISEIRELEESTGQKVALIVIDTLARHIQGDENSTRDMSEFIRVVDGLRDTFPDSTALIVHHTGNDAEKIGRSRGSSALKAACDFEIQCLKGILTFTKLKDGEAPPPIEFKLIPVEIGQDEDGEPITSCIVQYGERSAKNKEASLNAGERELLELVKSYPGILSGDLRTALFDKRKQRDPDAKYDTIKKAFSRSLDGLIEKGKVFMDGNYVREGQGTKWGHVPDIMGTDRDTPLKGVPMSPMSPAEIPFPEGQPFFDLEEVAI